MTVEIELGAATLAALNALTAALTMRNGGTESRRPTGEWLRMREGEREWGLSAPTIRKMVKEGKIEARNFGEKCPRYRLVSG